MPIQADQSAWEWNKDGEFWFNDSQGKISGHCGTVGHPKTISFQINTGPKTPDRLLNLIRYVSDKFPEFTVCLDLNDESGEHLQYLRKQSLIEWDVIHHPHSPDQALIKPLQQQPAPSAAIRNNSSTTTGPSRDMFGGPWLGLLVFILIAIVLGWGMSKLFQGMLDQTTQQLGAGELDHGFDPDTIYTLRQDLVLGYKSNGVQTLFPDRDALPHNAPGRRSMPSADEVRGMPAEELKARDLRGVVERNTRVRFVEVIDDRDNAQTRVLVRVELLDGRYASPTPVLGMHLESADTDEETGVTRYLPRADLFEAVPSPVQSSAPAP